MSFSGSARRKGRMSLEITLLLFVLLLGSVVVRVSDAAKLPPDEKMELLRSAARYRQYLVRRRLSEHELLQQTDENEQGEFHLKAEDEVLNVVEERRDSTNQGDGKEGEFYPQAEGQVLNAVEELTSTNQTDIKEEGEFHPKAEKEVTNAAEEQTATEEKSASYFLFEDPYKIGARIEDWDEKRASWLLANQHLKRTSDRKPRVLIVTGSQPDPCKSPEGDHFHLKALKNKIDYARMHNFQIYYNFAFLDPSLTGVWTKLPIARSLLLTHPEIEWLMWVDSDALFTDMLFEIPFDTYDDYNLVIWAWKDGFERKDWVAVNDGVFLLRNCQWSLDLFDKWSPMGKDGTVKSDAGKMLSSFLSNRGDNFPADDQSALMYVMLTDKSVINKVKLVDSEYLIHGYWVDLVDHFEELVEKYHPGLGDCRWPFTTHFTGCSPCSGSNNPNYSYEMCMRNFNRAFNFADNQVLAFMGYQHRTLNSSDVASLWNESASPFELSAFQGMNPWIESVTRVSSEPRQGCCGALRC